MRIEGYPNIIFRLDVQKMWIIILLVCMNIILTPSGTNAQQVDVQTSSEHIVRVRGFGIRITDQQGEEVVLYKESYALVIGISNYTHGWPKLPGVPHDVENIKTTLEAHGFDVIVQTDPDTIALDQAFTEFIDRYGLAPDNRLLIYFAGHGHTVETNDGTGLSYIVPADGSDATRKYAAGSRAARPSA